LQLIRDEIKAGKSDKEIYKKLEDEYGETVLYAPKFDLQTAGIWLSPVRLNKNLSFCTCFHLSGITVWHVLLLKS
jgi:cytochrome c-type biogenesis protein CcmH/NrfF